MIKVNKIKCKLCGDVIESTSVHDFKECSCGACYVDGGHEYLRRGWDPKRGEPQDIFEELSEYELESDGDEEGEEQDDGSNHDIYSLENHDED